MGVGYNSEYPGEKQKLNGGLVFVKGQSEFVVCL